MSPGPDTGLAGTGPELGVRAESLGALGGRDSATGEGVEVPAREGQRGRGVGGLRLGRGSRQTSLWAGSSGSQGSQSVASPEVEVDTDRAAPASGCSGCRAAADARGRSSPGSSSSSSSGGRSLRPRSRFSRSGSPSAQDWAEASLSQSVSRSASRVTGPWEGRDSEGRIVSVRPVGERVSSLLFQSEDLTIVDGLVEEEEQLTDSTH